MDPQEFLDTVTGYVAPARGAAGRAPRLATVDAGYTSGRPRVTFDGDTGLSAQGFEYLRPYVPQAGHRVLMLPVGNTYVIGGSIGG